MKSSIKRYHRECTNNKFQRPFSPDQALHVTLRSELARAEMSLLSPHTSEWLTAFVPQLSKKLCVRIYCWSINGNHLHFVINANSREVFQRFLRTLASRISCFVLGVRRGQGKSIRFWEGRPYSRVLSWGREFSNVMRYVERNIKESCRQYPYVNRDDKKQM